MRLERALRARQLIPLAAIWLLVGCGKQETVESTAVPPEVGVYTVKAQALTLTTDLPGRTSAYRVSEVRPQASGILQKRMFVEGAEVKQGEQLYQIDPRTYEALLARAEASLLTAQNLARRYERLLDTNAISQQQYDDAMATWKQAQAEAQMARINMQYTKVLAPITGRIGRSAVTEGALVTNGQAQELATVTQLDPIYVDVNQPITRLLGLKRALSQDACSALGIIRLKSALPSMTAHPTRSKEYSSSPRLASPPPPARSPCVPSSPILITNCYRACSSMHCSMRASNRQPFWFPIRPWAVMRGECLPYGWLSQITPWNRVKCKPCRP